MLSTSSKPFIKPSLYSRVKEDGTVLIGVTPQDAIELNEIDDFQTDLLTLLDGGLTVEEITEILQDKGYTATNEDVLFILNQLYEYKIIEDNLVYLNDETLNNEVKNRFDRQLLLFSALSPNGFVDSVQVQKKIENAHVTLIGIGGIGSYVLYALAAMGVGKLTVVEFDDVEISNLSRQIIYNEKDVGRPKIVVAEERANLINSSIEYNFINKKINSPTDFEEVIEGSDLAILAADNPRGKISYWMDEAAHNKNVPYMQVGSAHTMALCGPIIIPGKTCRWEDTFPEKTTEDHPITEFINNRYKPAIIDPYNATAASIASLEAIKFLTNFSECRIINRRWFMDLSTLETYFQEIEIDEKV